MVEVIFFKGEHFGVVLAMVVPPFQILLIIAHVLDVLVLDVAMGAFLFDDFVDLAGVEVDLRGGVFGVEVLVDGRRRVDWVFGWVC